MSFRKYSSLVLVLGGVFLFFVPSVSAHTLSEGEKVGALFPIATPVHSIVRGTIVGDQVTFSIEPTFDSGGRTSLTATLRVVGSRSFVYVEDAYFAALSSSDQNNVIVGAQALSTAFDSIIYPKLTAFYGVPWEPGIDGDLRITLLLTKLVSNAGGYMNTTDEYPKSLAPDSNEREMLYLNVKFVTQARQISAFASHEFTHVIDFNQKKKIRNVEDEVWLNELRAEYAPTQAGYDDPYTGSNLSSRVAAFRANPSDSVTEWKNAEADYGSIAMFGHYLAGQYGARVLAASMQTSAIGTASIDEGLLSVGASDRFADAFQKWAVANSVNSSQVGAAYVYTQPDLAANFSPVSPTASVAVGPTGIVTVDRQIEDWTGQWIQASPSGSGNERLTVSVSSSAPVRAAAILQKTNGERSVQFLNAKSTSASLSIDDISAYALVLVAPVFMGKTIGFSTGSATGTFSDEPLRSYTVSFERASASAPLITSVSPGNVLSFGGALVTVRGSGFAKGSATVTLDGQSIPATIIDDGTLTFIAPAHAAGNICLRITVNAELDERCDLFKYWSFADGSLIRGDQSPHVWILKGHFRRHIVSAAIFSFYGHFSWTAVQVVPEELIGQYRLSAWVRLPLTTDSITWRVYEVNDDATKHWITCANPDQCGPTWLAHGGDPEGIYTVNQQEMNFYTEGPVVFLQ